MEKGSSNNFKKWKVTIVILCIVCALLMSAVSLSIDCWLVGNQEEPPTKPPVDLLQIKSVVQIQTSNNYGSGVVVMLGSEPYIITNFHVVETGEHINVRQLGEISFTKANLIGYNAFHDIALLKCSLQNYVAANILVSDYGYGQKIRAVGNNLGHGLALFDGIVSAPGKMLKTTDLQGVDKNVPVVQITAPINAGMSGGGLFDENGYLIGINTYQGAGTDRPIDGVSYSVPMGIVYPLIKEMVLADEVGSTNKLFSLTSLASSNEMLYFSSAGFMAQYEDSGLCVISASSMVDNLGGTIEKGDVITHIGDLKVTVTTPHHALFAEVYKYSSVERINAKNLTIQVQRKNEAQGNDLIFTVTCSGYWQTA